MQTRKIMYTLLLTMGIATSCLAKKAEATKVMLKTNYGNIEIELYPKKAPQTVKNFLRYVKENKYNGTIFHRVIDGFMIQGGGLTPDMKKVSAHRPIKNEADNGLKNEAGTIAMARTGTVDSATNQFFINVNDNDFLNHKSKDPKGFGYAVFGKVTKGMPIINKIKMIKTAVKNGRRDVPTQDVIIQSARKL